MERKGYGEVEEKIQVKASWMDSIWRVLSCKCDAEPLMASKYSHEPQEINEVIEMKINSEPKEKDLAATRVETSTKEDSPKFRMDSSIELPRLKSDHPDPCNDQVLSNQTETLPGNSDNDEVAAVISSLKDEKEYDPSLSGSNERKPQLSFCGLFKWRSSKRK